MPQIDVKTRDGIAVCTLSPPDGFMTETTVAELDAFAAGLEADGGVRVAILTGGRAGEFIRHYSVRDLEAMSRELRGRSLSFGPERLVKERPIDLLFRRLAGLPQPVIAALNGTAMGGGFELALACDLRLAQDGPYDLGLPESNIGLLPGAGGTQRLARLIGTARALELVLRGRTVRPREALALGMVHEVTDGPVLDRALALAAELAAKPPLALAHIKRLIRREAETPLDDALALERTLFLDLLLSDDALARMAAMNRGERDIRER